MLHYVGLECVLQLGQETTAVGGEPISCSDDGFELITIRQFLKLILEDAVFQDKILQNRRVGPSVTVTSFVRPGKSSILHGDLDELKDLWEQTGSPMPEEFNCSNFLEFSEAISTLPAEITGEEAPRPPFIGHRVCHFHFFPLG